MTLDTTPAPSESASVTGAPALRVFSDPASVAVVGASDDPAKWGYWLASGALRGADRREVHLVNRRAGHVLGRPCFASLADAPSVPELVALCVPAEHVPGVVDEGLRLGVRGFLGITAGVADEPELAARIRAGGARLVGANSLGVFDAQARLQLVWGELLPGPLAIVSQSGQLATEIATIGARRGVGVSRFASIGNQSDVTAAELLADLADHDATRAVAVYLESFTDGRLLFDVLGALRAAGKPTVLLTVGASAASTRLARSHTGSLTSPLDVVDAVCRATGVLRARTPAEVIDVVRAVLAGALPAGPRVAIIGDSGGQSAVAADVAAAAGLAVPQLSEGLTARLAEVLPAGAACDNPVDLAGAGERDLANYPALVRRVAESGEVDAVVLTGYFGCYGVDAPARADEEAAIARRLGAVAAETGRPVFAHTMGPDTPVAGVLADSGVPAFGDIDSTLRALAGAVRLGEDPPEVPGVDEAMAAGLEAAAAGEPVVVSGYWAARGLLAAVGVTLPQARVVREPTDLAAADLRFPVVLKAGWLEHKSEVGGVVVGIADADELAEAFAEMRSRLGAGDGACGIGGVGDYVVECQDTRRHVVEVLVGARRDPELGPVVVVGAGGTETELHRDVRLECAPVSVPTAARMIAGLRCAPLLAGWRGRPPVAADELAVLVARISQLVAARPEIAEIELNPVRVGTDSALPVDALIVTDTRENPR